MAILAQLASLFQHSSILAQLASFFQHYLPPFILAFLIRNSALLPLVLIREPMRWITAPLPAYKDWYRDVIGEGWRGVWVGEGFALREVSAIEAELRDGDADLVMVYVHGGAFRLGHATMFLEQYVQWINVLQKDYHGIKLRILSLEYGLSPEHRYPSAILESVEAYRYVSETLSIPASKIILAGDSAGGNVVLAALYHLYEISLPPPSSILCISPVVIDITTAASMKSNAYSDFISPSLIELAVFDYLPPDGTVAVTDPHISILLTPTEVLVQWLPQRMCITVGGREVMRDDIVLFAKRVQAEAQGTECLMVEVEEGVHNWFIMPWMLRNKEMWDRKSGVVMEWLAGAAEGKK